MNTYYVNGTHDQQGIKQQPLRIGDTLNGSVIVQFSVDLFYQVNIVLSNGEVVNATQLRRA